MAASTWELDLSVLTMIADLEAEAHFTLGSDRIVERTGLDHDTVIAAVRRLKRGDYVDGNEAIGGGEIFGDFLHLELTERGLRTTGVWPSEDVYDSLLEVLNSKIDDTTDPDEKSRLERLRDGAVAVGKDVGTSVLVGWLKHMAGI